MIKTDIRARAAEVLNTARLAREASTTAAPGDDIRELRRQLADGEMDFDLFEMAS